MNSRQITDARLGGKPVAELRLGRAIVWRRRAPRRFAGAFAEGSQPSDWWYLIGDEANAQAEKVYLPSREFNVEIPSDKPWIGFYYNAGVKYGSKLARVDLSPIGKETVSTHCMFCEATVCKEINCTADGTPELTDTNHMFNGCYKLERIDLRGVDTSRVTNMYAMFHWCYALADLHFGVFDMGSVTKATYMFTDDRSLANVTGEVRNLRVSLDLSRCPLTNDSAMVFIRGLADTAVPRVLSLKASTYDTLTPEQIATATAKGWTLSRV